MVKVVFLSPPWRIRTKGASSTSLPYWPITFVFLLGHSKRIEGRDLNGGHGGILLGHMVLGETRADNPLRRSVFYFFACQGLCVSPDATKKIVEKQGRFLEGAP